MDDAIGRRKLHPYARVSLFAALIALGVNLALILPLLAEARGLLFGRVGYATVFTVVLAMTSVGLGVHALIKRRWPGRTATEQARRPTPRDVRVVLAALSLTLVDLTLLFVWWLVV